MQARRFIALALCHGLLAASAAFCAEPLLEKTDLWQAGQGGYKLYRIPGIVVTARGTILAYAEARRYTGGDWDTIDIVMRRSTDNGKTFSPQRVMAHVPPLPRSRVAIERKQGNADDLTYNNPVAIADKNGTVHFLFCRDYMRVFYMRSEDDGLTFSTPVDITSTLDAYRPQYQWRVAATGPGHGIQLESGRLLVPVWLALGTEGNGHQPSVDSTIYSDDDGKTWRRGDIAVSNTPDTPDPNETSAVQLADGRVLLNVRTASPRNERLVVASKDGAHHWSKPEFQPGLPDPICFASIVRLSSKRDSSRNWILFANPDNLARSDGKPIASKDRRNLTVRLSYDEAKTWPVKRALEPGPSGYSDLAVSPNGIIWCFYEAGRSPHERLVLAKFNLEWLTGGRDSLARKAN